MLLQIFSNDNLPQTICEECCKNIDGFFNFKEMIINNDAILKKRYVEHAAEVLNEKVDDAAIDLDLFEPVRIKSEVLEPISRNENTNNVLECVGNTNTDCVDVIPRREEDLIDTHEATENSMTQSSSCGEHIPRISLEKHEKWDCINPVSCGECGEFMKNNHFLKTHIKIIHEKVSHHCERCNRDFAVYKDFKKHTSKCHSKKNRKSKRNAQQNDNHRNQKRTSAPINCTCNVCGMFCNSKRQLQKHMRSQHGKH